MATSPQLVLIHRSALAGLNIAGRMLDQACAAAVADACMLEHEADLDRLIFHPEEPVHSIHARHLATAPASAREAIEQAGGLILESGPSGHTVMVGDQVDPSSVTTMVAGVSSGDPAKLGLQLEQARAVAVATGGAVIVWQGYSPPPTLIDGISPSSAAAGADDLSAFQMALNERFPEARKLVVGHSYGSVVSALAAEDGLFADELVLVGSPGVASISDLNLLSEDPHVTVADSPTDPILALRSPLVSAHGVDPASPWFGAERIEGIRGNHTDYFYDPAFLAGIAERARR